jgi:hypothetical protein
MTRLRVEDHPIGAVVMDAPMRLAEPTDGGKPGDDADANGRLRA